MSDKESADGVTRLTPRKGKKSAASTRTRLITNDDSHMDSMKQEYEKNLAQKRKERQEARYLRMKQLEADQQNLDDSQANNDGATSTIPSTQQTPSIDTSATYGLYNSRHRSNTNPQIAKSEKDLKVSLKELEEKLTNVQVERAELESEKSSLIYQVDQLKDIIEEYELTITQLKIENKKRLSEREAQKKMHDAANRKILQLKNNLDQRDQLIRDSGLVAIPDTSNQQGVSAIVSRDVAKALQIASNQEGDAGDSIDTMIMRISQQRDNYAQEVQELQQQLQISSSSTHVPTQRQFNTMEEIISDPLVELHVAEIQRDAQRQVAEYKLKYQKAEQDIANLQATCNRLEGQASRFKSDAEHFEAAEVDLKAERRTLQRDNRALKEQLEELEATNQHLERRLERMRQNRDRFQINN